MSDVLDLGPIKARLAATTPGAWKWADEIRDVPYDDESWIGDRHVPTGNDGSLGVDGLYVEIAIDDDTSQLIAVLYADDETIPDDPDDPDDVDWSKWRGLIHAGNLADLEFIAMAKTDIGALIAEVELLRASAGT
jgi:hypothetical protein